MGKFDISQAADFSRITQQTLQEVNALLGGRDPNEWDIVEASYNGVVFHVFESKQRWQGALPRVTDTGGRRKVRYQYPYRDGQTTDDLGRKPGSFEMECAIFGNRYFEGFQALLNEFDKPQPGVLVHPVRGKLTCAIEDFSVVYESQSRKMVQLRVTFIEHNFTIGSLRELNDSGVKSALSAALKIFAIIDTAISKIEAAQLLVRAVKNRINQYLALFKTNNAQTLTAMNATFNAKGGTSDIPSLLPTNQGGTRNADGSLATQTFITVRSPSDPFNSVPTSELTKDVVIAAAVNDLTKQVVARRTELATILNEIHDNGGSLELYDTVVELRTTAVLLQNVLERGVASSNARVYDYVVPRIMSLREAAFLNGLNPNRVQELDILNPSLESINYIATGTTIKVPSS
jgi:prophage DNA circulation protein